jgi:L-serine deaminase
VFSRAIPALVSDRDKSRSLAMDDRKEVAGNAITRVASYGLAMGEENARGHIIVPVPTPGSVLIPCAIRSHRKP